MPELQVEPPGPDLPADGDEAPPDEVGPLGLTAALAAAVLAVASAGHLVVLGLLLALVARTRAGAVAALLAVLAVLVRWGGPALSAVAGDQAVLGPAVLVGSVAAGASAVLAALAIALLAPRSLPVVAALAALAIALLAPRSLPVVAALAVVAGAVVAGPELPTDLPIRLAGVLVAGGVAYAARWVPLRHLAAAVAAGVALLLAAVA